jgi:hypothetical protein
LTSSAKNIVVEDWYVIFAPTRTKHWIYRFIDPYFQHCYMVKEDLGLWVIVDSKSCHTSVTTELVQDFPHIRLLCPNSIIIPVQVRIDIAKDKWHLGMNTCVDVCKGLLGLNKFWIWTPYQLYRYLYERRG